ncbi:MAG: amidase [Alcaligenaceae bacterium]|nr:amidase [Alcaligenaceae bacterium]
MDVLYEQSIESLQQALQRGELRSIDLVQASLQRIAAYDQAGPCLNALLHLNPRALEQAETCDAERRQGMVHSPLHGLPVVVKDNFQTHDMPTTGGSRVLAGFQPRHDAWQVQRLRQAGAIIVGKTTLHELAAGITNASSLSGHTRNPYDPEHIPGGSSGGTAVAVAASYAVAGLGSDTSGSIRVPAACQNLYGLRPTWGLSSRSGIIPLCPSQDIGAPLARTVRDLAIMLDATVGPDPSDPATWQAAHWIPASYRAGLQPGRVHGLRIGVLTSLFGNAAHEQETSDCVLAALDTLRDLGATVVPIETPTLETQTQAASLTAHEFKFALADYLQAQAAPVRSLTELLAHNAHHPEVDATLRLRDQPAHRDTAERTQAIMQRSAVRRFVTELMMTHDVTVLASPTLRCTPVRIGERQPGQNCALSPVLGWPALCLPAGFSATGLPIGLDLLAPPHSEQALLNYALDWEASGVRRRAPFFFGDRPRFHRPEV